MKKLIKRILFNEYQANLLFFLLQMNLLIFQNPQEFFQFFFYIYENNDLLTIEVITAQLLVQSPGEFLCVIWNLVTKTYSKFVRLHSFLKIFNKFSKT